MIYFCFSGRKSVYPFEQRVWPLLLPRFWRRRRLGRSSSEQEHESEEEGRGELAENLQPNGKAGGRVHLLVRQHTRHHGFAGEGDESERLAS